jgi:hypothetical protein
MILYTTAAPGTFYSLGLGHVEMSHLPESLQERIALLLPLADSVGAEEVGLSGLGTIRKTGTSALSVRMYIPLYPWETKAVEKMKRRKP